MDFLRHDRTRRCIVICEEGTILWDGIDDKVWIFEKGGETWKTICAVPVGRDHSYKEQIGTFVGHVLSGDKSGNLASARDAISVLHTVECAKKSNLKKVCINIPKVTLI